MYAGISSKDLDTALNGVNAMIDSFVQKTTKEYMQREKAARRAVGRIHAHCGLAALEAFDPTAPNAIQILRDSCVEVEEMTPRLAAELRAAAAELAAEIQRRIQGGRYVDGAYI